MVLHHLRRMMRRWGYLSWIHVMWGSTSASSHHRAMTLWALTNRHRVFPLDSWNSAPHGRWHSVHHCVRHVHGRGCRVPLRHSAPSRPSPHHSASKKDHRSNLVVRERYPLFALSSDASSRWVWYLLLHGCVSHGDRLTMAIPRTHLGESGRTMHETHGKICRSRSPHWALRHGLQGRIQSCLTLLTPSAGHGRARSKAWAIIS
mmetsp:Transcript_13778/g.21510  ORF Transcript_13778/g.21510 Transcript_13778/m.21510 type:complete len:204 (-) Transcript_13778:183-794(-)